MGAGGSTQIAAAPRSSLAVPNCSTRQPPRRARTLNVYPRKEAWRPDMGTEQVGAVMAVHRLPDFAAGADTAPRAAATAMYDWYVQDLDHPGQWERYPDESAARLERAYLTGSPECLVVHRHRTCTVDLVTMQQTASGGGAASPVRVGQLTRSRNVRRVRVECVVDPVTGREERHEVRSAAVDPFADDDNVDVSADAVDREFAATEQDGADLRTRLQQPQSSTSTMALPRKGGTERLVITPLTSATRTGPTLLRTIQAHVGPLFTMTLAPQGGLSSSLVLNGSGNVGAQSCSMGTLCSSAGTVLTAGKGGAIVEWDLASAGVRMDYDSPMPPSLFVLAANYNRAGSRFVAGLNDKTARLYNVGKEEPVHTLRGHTNKVYDAKFTLDDERVVTVAMDGCVCVWDAERGTQTRKESCSGSHLFALAVSSLDAAVALSVGNDALLNVHDFRKPQSVVGRIAGHGRTLWSCDMSNDDVFYLSAGMDGTVRVWDSRSTRQALQVMSYHDGPVHYAHFTANNRGVLSCGKDGAVVLANTDTGDAAWKARAHKTAVFRVCYHHPSRLMLTCSVQGVVGVWQWDAGAEW